MVFKRLEVYQYEAGKIGLILEKVNLQELVESCCQQLLPLAEANSIQIANKISRSTPAVQADSDQLKRLLINLLGNAIQHLQLNGSIQVGAVETPHSIELMIQDNGPGISPERMPYLFDRYFAVEQTSKKIGSGLGLSICKMIVKLHGGSIRAESQIGKGTTFYVTLPLTQKASG